MKNKYLIYPIIKNSSLFEKIIIRLNFSVIYCPICNNVSYIRNLNKENLRESCICKGCSSTNRQRQMYFAFQQHIKNLKSVKKIVIYNTESSGPVHNKIKDNKHYIFSEYFGEKYKSGQKIKNIRHEDLMNLSFDNDSIDIILSSDVFEHISEPYKAHKEIYRVLKKRGCHIFTVPFMQNDYLDQKRAKINKKGNLVHLLPPIYHLDGIRPDEGALVFNLFSIEMLVKLREIGFNTEMYFLHKPEYGIIGPNQTVFIAKK